MLERVRFKNYKSFSKETVIDLRPSKIEYLNDTNVNDGVLKGCAFYGSNASGKTSALNAITILLDLLFKNVNLSLIDSFTRFNNEPKMYFEYTFKIDNSHVIYFFEIDKSKGITAEKLMQDETVLLNRTLTSAKSYITENQDYDEIDHNFLFLKMIYFNTKFNGFPILYKWFEYLKKSIFFNPLRAISSFVTFDNKVEREIYLEQYLEKYGVEDINSFLNRFNFKFKIAYRKNNATLVPFVNRLQIDRQGMTSIPFRMESAGNQILLSFLPSYLSVIRNGGILAIDEFSSGFHNDLEELLVKYFFDECQDGQIFFVSHSTNILKTNIIRPDQVYAVDFDEEGSKLTKFSHYGMRESQNMEKMYLSGAFGGIPLYGDQNQ